MSGNTEKYYQGPVGDIFLRPMRVRLRGTFTASGATVTMSTTRRQSHPGALCTGAAGTYAVTGLPPGLDYHVAGIHINPGTGTKLIDNAEVSARDASAGTLTFLTRQSSDGAVTAPADNTTFEIALDVEGGG
jgi:hypothetical protein